VTTDPVEPLRIGVLGAARIAERGIAVPPRDTGSRLVAIAARDPARAEAFARAQGVERVLPSYADVLADPEVEAVYNPLPNVLHGPWNLAAIAAGKHVLSEKPFASDAAEAAEVRDAAHRAGVTVMEGFHHLYHPVMRRLLELVDSGELGDVVHVEATVAMLPPDAGDPRWSLELAGGALMDLGCYGLHALRSLAPWTGGEPEPLTARAGERAGAPGVDEWLDADLRFPSGATATVCCSMVHPDRDFSLRRGDGAGVRRAEPGRPRAGAHPGRRADRAPRHPDVVHVPTGGVHRRDPERDTGPHRPGRRGRDHDTDRPVLRARRAAAPAAGGHPAAPRRGLTRRHIFSAAARRFSAARARPSSRE
jgi:predicted dehydrogenase